MVVSEAQQRAEVALSMGVEPAGAAIRRRDELARDVLALVEENKELLGGLYLTKHNLEKAEARVAAALAYAHSWLLIRRWHG